MTTGSIISHKQSIIYQHDYRTKSKKNTKNQVDNYFYLGQCLSGSTEKSGGRLRRNRSVDRESRSTLVARGKSNRPQQSVLGPTGQQSNVAGNQGLVRQKRVGREVGIGLAVVGGAGGCVRTG